MSGVCAAVDRPDDFFATRGVMSDGVRDPFAVAGEGLAVGGKYFFNFQPADFFNESIYSPSASVPGCHEMLGVMVFRI